MSIHDADKKKKEEEVSIHDTYVSHFSKMRISYLTSGHVHKRNIDI